MMLFLDTSKARDKVEMTAKRLKCTIKTALGLSTLHLTGFANYLQSI